MLFGCAAGGEWQGMQTPSAGMVVAFGCLATPSSVALAGGASLSLHSLQSAGLGAAAALPLIIAKAALWTDAARQRFPILEEIQRREAETAAPVLSNMSPAQVSCL